MYIYEAGDNYINIAYIFWYNIYNNFFEMSFL